MECDAFKEEREEVRNFAEREFQDWSPRTILCLNNDQDTHKRKQMANKMSTYLKKTGLIHNI